jgi:archaellum component FlaC
MQIQENTNKQAEQKNFLDILEHQLNVYKTEHTTIQNEVQRCKSQSEAKMQTIQKSIDKLRENFTDIENEAAAFRREFGPTITDNLTQVETLNKNLHHENSIGSQVASILKGTWKVCIQ